MEAEYIHVADPETPWTKLELLMPSPGWFPLQTSFIYTEALSACEETQLAPPCSQPQRYPSTSDSFQNLPICVYNLCPGPVSPPCAHASFPASPFPRLYLCCSGLCPLCAFPNICKEDFFQGGFLEEVVAKPRTQTDLSQAATASAAAYTQKQDGARWLRVRNRDRLVEAELPGPRKML